MGQPSSVGVSFEELVSDFSENETEVVSEVAKPTKVPFATPPQMLNTEWRKDVIHDAQA